MIYMREMPSRSSFSFFACRGLAVEKPHRTRGRSLTEFLRVYSTRAFGFPMPGLALRALNDRATGIRNWARRRGGSEFLVVCEN